MTHRTARSYGATAVLLAILSLTAGGFAYAYTCAIDISKDKDVGASGDIVAWAKVLATAENETEGIAFAEYEAKVSGCDVHGPNQTGAWALLEYETIELAWAPDGEPSGTWVVQCSYSFLPRGWGRTWVTGGSTIDVLFSINTVDFVFLIDDVDYSPPSEAWPVFQDRYIDNAGPRDYFRQPDLGLDMADVPIIGSPPDIEAFIVTSTYAAWEGENPDDTPPAPTASHNSDVHPLAKCTLTVPPPMGP